VSLDPSEEGVWIIPAFEETAAAPGGGAQGAPTGTTGVVTDGSGNAGTTAAGPGVPTGSGGGTSTPGSGSVAYRKVMILGSVPAESWTDVFRSIVGPASRMQLRKLRLGIAFELEAPTDRPLSSNDDVI